MHHTAPEHPAQESALPDRAPWTILALMAVAQFMVILDITVVNVALPSIGLDLGFAANELQWVVTAYVIFTGGLLLLGGRMADLLGRRVVFLSGLLLFTGASLASGLAWSPEALIVSRAAQGLGAALLSPAALSVVATSYTGAQRTTALSVWGAIGAGGAAAGVVFGGMLVSWLSWEWVFLINVPIGLAAAALTLHLVPAARRDKGSLRRLDAVGALALVAGLVLAVYAVEGAGAHGWASTRTLLLFAASGALLIAFARIERVAQHPLVPPVTWRTRSLVSSATVMLAATGALIGVFFLNSLYLQHVLDASPLETGVAFLPLVVTIGFAAHAGPHVLARWGARAVVVAGLTLIAAGNVLLSGADAEATYLADLLPGFALIGLGVGLSFVAVSVTAMADVQGERAGLASGLMTTAHELGAAFGVAIFSGVALGSGVDLASGGSFVDGYGDGSLVGAFIAGAFALVAIAVIPPFRPAAAQRLAMH